MSNREIALSILLLHVGLASAATELYTSPFSRYGEFEAHANTKELILGNDAIAVGWSIADGHLKLASIQAGGRTVPPDGEAFEMVMNDGSVIKASSLQITDSPSIANTPAAAESPKLSDHFGGKTIALTLQDSGKTFTAVWAAIGHDGGNYIRQQLTLTPNGGALPLRKIVMFDGALPQATSSGPKKGPVIIAGNIFIGLEHPISHATVNGTTVSCDIDRAIDLSPGQVQSASLVIGAARDGQMRRDFQGYIERERAHPYRPFLHYNSWFDLAFNGRFTSDEFVERIKAFGTELTQKRGVVLDSFLLDDGWDETSKLWRFHDGFPDGLQEVASTAKHYGASPGIWLSPWGLSKGTRCALGDGKGGRIRDE